MADDALATYLKDHYAGAAGGASLARQLAEGASAPEEGEQLEEIAIAIEEDQRILRQLMERLSIEPAGLKQAGAKLGEKLGRVKLHSSGGENRVLQYESMIMGVTGKLQLWNSLLSLTVGDPRLNIPELERMKARAEEQRAGLERLHDQVAGQALGGD
jgi:hypothetical protein